METIKNILKNINTSKSLQLDEFEKHARNKLYMLGLSMVDQSEVEMWFTDFMRKLKETMKVTEKDCEKVTLKETEEGHWQVFETCMFYKDNAECSEVGKIYKE